MKIGDIAYLKPYSDILGEIKAISDDDKVTLVLCDSNIKIVADITDLSTYAKVNQPHFEDTECTILGTPYTILFRTAEQDPRLKQVDGLTDISTKELFIRVNTQDMYTVSDLTGYTKKVMRHEIVHAFLYESGLWNDSKDTSSWALNEEMVDWIAIQLPKIAQAYKEAGCYE